MYPAQPSEVIFSAYFSRMNEFRSENLYCDVNIVLDDGSSFPCHRVILASASNFFKAMFAGSFIESSQKEVKLKDISAECFEKTLDFIYCNEFSIIPENCVDLLNTASFLVLDEMENRCLKYIVSLISVENILKNRTLSRLRRIPKLYEKALDYVAENIRALISHDFFLEISSEVLEDIIEHGRLRCTADEIILSIERWKQNKGICEDQIQQLVSHISSQPQVVCNYGFSRLCVQFQGPHNDCHELLFNGFSKKWRHNYDVADLCYSKNVVFSGQVFTLGAYCTTRTSSDYNKFQVQEFDTENTRFLAYPPHFIHVYDMAAFHDTVYLYNKKISININMGLIAEIEDVEKSKQIFAYVNTLDKWFNIPKPSHETRYSCLTSLNNMLYLIGGKPFFPGCQGSSTKLTQCYDHRSNKWMMLPEKLIDRRPRAVCSYDEKLYTISRTNNTMELEVYDPKAAKWQMVLQSPQYLYDDCCFVNYEDHLWLISGGKCKPVECFNPITNVWTESKSLWDNTNEIKTIFDAFVL